MSRRESQSPQGHCGILVLPGGNNAAMLQYQPLLDHEVVIPIDAPNELAHNLPNPLPATVKAFPLGQGHTAKTLAARASPSIQDCISNAAGMDAEAGLGQLRAVGFLAARRLLRSRDMRRFLRQGLFDTLVQRCGGIPDHIVIEGKGSLAGGTASAIVFLVAFALARALLKTSDSTISVTLTLTGGLTYSGCGRRVHTNTAAAIVDALGFALRRHHPRMICSLRLMELPPVGTDCETRARHMLEVEQAVQVETLRKILDQNAPNNSLNGPLGNVTLWQSGYFEPLHPRFHVARDIAPEFCRDLRQAIAESKPDPSSVERLPLTVRSEQLPREDLETLAERIPISDPDELLATATLPGEKLHLTVNAVLRSGEVLSLSEPQTAWSISPSTLREARERLIVQLSCIDATRSEIARLQAELTQADDQCQLAEHEFARAVRKLQRRGLWSWLRRALLGADQRPPHLGALVRDVRATSDQVRQLQSVLAAFKNALRQVEIERDYIVLRIKTIIDRLDALVPRSHGQHEQTTVVARHIDTVLKELWRIDDRVTDDQVAKLLLRAVARVTMHGLAIIVGAESGRLEAIANQIAHCRFAAETPPWAGKPRLQEGLQVHVLPPVAPETADKLKEMIHELSPNSTIAVAEQMPASINCVTLRITTVDHVQEVLPNYLRRNLLEAYYDKHRDMYFPFGTSALDESGIAIDGHVRFRKTNQADEGVSHATDDTRTTPR